MVSVVESFETVTSPHRVVRGEFEWAKAAAPAPELFCDLATGTVSGAAEIRMDGTTPAKGLGVQATFSVLCPFGWAMGLPNSDEVAPGKA
jgi:hypothetical protein